MQSTNAHRRDAVQAREN
uniref:Uncharacterized protein n=1 Tax=Rhizophora mucronata TaxID=61149 RepID=A0A2P2K9F2_RHIMU